MVAWMDRGAVEKTLATGVTHFWSRSRGVPWRKGETSGHTQHVQAVYADCDADVVLVQVHQEGVACHTGQPTCFFNALRTDTAPGGPIAPANMLERLKRTIAARRANPPSGSYVAKLFAAGEGAICRKIGEEATEGITAALGGGGGRADLELRHRASPAGMLANASCDGHAGAPGLDALARHLLMGFRDRVTLERGDVEVNGRLAAHTVLDGQL